MNTQNNLPAWSAEILETLASSNGIGIALYSIPTKSLSANNAFIQLIPSFNTTSFIHPTFKHLLDIKEEGLIFSGYITFGDNLSVNHSLACNVYRKNDEILILGDNNLAQMIAQNKEMHALNQEIINLQRNLLKEKKTLQQTLEQLNVLNNKLIQLNDDKDQFVSILAHDLRNPFAVMLGYGQMLNKKLENAAFEDAKKYAGVINSTINKTYNLLENLLTWSRSQMNRIKYKPEYIKLKEIINETIELFENQINAKDIFVATEDIKDSLVVRGDKQMIKTVLRNLFSNAIKYTPQQGSIQFSAQYNTSQVTISLKDSGVGMSPETVNKLWNLSTRNSEKGTNGETGTGFGLLICKDFVEKHGGHISVESKPNKGSVFSFNIPQ